MSKNKSASQILKKRARKEKKSVLARAVKWVLLGLAGLAVAAVGTVAGVYYYLSEDLPQISSLADYHPPIVTTVYSDDNRKIAEFFRERRIVVPLAEIPERLVQAFVAAEDSRFYKHGGIDFLSIIRAFFKNLEAGTIVQGGSTITQQVTKSFLLTPERSYQRKIKEAILAYRIDRIFSKEEILFLYLNQIYLGHGAYGVQAAAENYFGKSVVELNLAEVAILAGLPQAPSRYSPFRHPERARERQIYVLNRMVAEGYITNIEATEAINTQLDIRTAQKLVYRGGAVLYRACPAVHRKKIRHRCLVQRRSQGLYGGQHRNAADRPAGGRGRVKSRGQASGIPGAVTAPSTGRDQPVFAKARPPPRSRFPWRPAGWQRGGRYNGR